MIDLHLHTNYSDGADSLVEILKKSEELKLEYISITDHDNCNAYEELSKIDVKKYYTGRIIPGIEIKCGYKGRLIELLGYNIDTKIINNFMKQYYKNNSKDKLQQKYFNILYDKCIKMGLTMNEKENVEFNSKIDWASVKIYEEIKKHDENKEKLPEDFWNEFNTFSKKYCGNKEYPLYIDKSKDYISVKEGINIIKKAGGLVFLPHIFIYKWAEDKIQLLEDLIKEYEIDGLECMHSEFTEKEISYLVEFSKENGFFKSGGSDYHGKNKPGIEMAIGKGNLKIENKK